MSMTKKHYSIVADTIKGRIENAELSFHFGYSKEDIKHATDTLEDLADMMAYELAQYDSKFDKDKFLKACGVID